MTTIQYILLALSFLAAATFIGFGFYVLTNYENKPSEGQYDENGNPK